MKSLSRFLKRCTALASTLALAAAVCAGVAHAGEGTTATESMKARPAKEADRMEALPSRLKGVDVTEHLGASLPKDLMLKNSDGQDVRFGDLFDGKRPVVLTFNYSNCPMLCSLQLSRFVQTLGQLKRTAGNDFQIATVSIDPAETVERARE